VERSATLGKGAKLNLCAPEVRCETTYKPQIGCAQLPWDQVREAEVRVYQPDAT